MADIPSTPPVTPPPPVPPASGGVPVIEAVVNTVPDKIQQLARQLELSGTLSQPPTANSITLSTVAGQLTIMLPQLVAAQKDKLLQQLLTLFQNNKPLTVVMQPGNPPTQAFLLLPSATGQSQTAPSATTNLTQGNAVQQPPPPLLPNTVLSAVVLPKALPNNISFPLQQTPSLSANAPAPPASPPNADFSGSFARNQPSGLPLNTGAASEPITNNPGQEPSLAPQGYTPEPSVPGSFPGLPPQAEPPVLSSLTAEQIVTQQALTDLAGNTPAPATPLPANPPATPQIAGSYPAPQAATTPALPTAAPANITPTATAATPATAAAVLQPGTEVNLRIMTILAPNVQSSVPSAPNQILATVAGNGPGGQLILKAGDATLYVRQPANLPPGTQLILTVEAGKMGIEPLTLPDPQQFPALQQAIAALAQADPALARQVIEANLPQPGAALPGALLFFLSAIRQGDIRNWLGNGAVDLLARLGKFDLVQKLTQELQQGGQTARDAVVGEWKSYPLPLHDQNQFQIINLYVHRDSRHGSQKGEQDGRPGAEQIRFLIDMRMSRLGAMQLDGFIKRRQLDIMVRSERPLPAGLHDELRGSYINTLSAIDYAGSINFQTGRQNWLNIQKPAAAQAGVLT